LDEEKQEKSKQGRRGGTKEHEDRERGREGEKEEASEWSGVQKGMGDEL
jgi:hypothetical protein